MGDTLSQPEAVSPGAESSWTPLFPVLRGAETLWTSLRPVSRHSDVEINLHGHRHKPEDGTFTVPAGMRIVLVCGEECATRVVESNENYVNWMSTAPRHWRDSLLEFEHLLNDKATLPDAEGWCVFEAGDTLKNRRISGEYNDPRKGMRIRPMSLTLWATDDPLHPPIRIQNGSCRLIEILGIDPQPHMGDDLRFRLGPYAPNTVKDLQMYRLVPDDSIWSDEKVLEKLGSEKSAWTLKNLIMWLRPGDPTVHTVNVYLFVCMNELLPGKPLTSYIRPKRRITAVDETVATETKRPKGG